MICAVRRALGCLLIAPMLSGTPTPKIVRARSLLSASQILREIPRPQTLAQVCKVVVLMRRSQESARNGKNDWLKRIGNVAQTIFGVIFVGVVAAALVWSGL